MCAAILRQPSMAKRTVSITQDELRRRFRDDLRDKLGADLYGDDATDGIEEVLRASEHAKQSVIAHETEFHRRLNEKDTVIQSLKQRIGVLESQERSTASRLSEQDRVIQKLERDNNELVAENRRLADEVSEVRAQDLRNRVQGVSPASSSAATRHLQSDGCGNVVIAEEQLKTVTLLWRDAVAKIEVLQTQNRSLEQELHILRNKKNSAVAVQRQRETLQIQSLQEEVHRLRLRLQHEHNLHQEHSEFILREHSRYAQESEEKVVGLHSYSEGNDAHVLRSGGPKDGKDRTVPSLQFLDDENTGCSTSTRSSPRGGTSGPNKSPRISSSAVRRVPTLRSLSSQRSSPRRPLSTLESIASHLVVDAWEDDEAPSSPPLMSSMTLRTTPRRQTFRNSTNLRATDLRPELSCASTPLLLDSREARPLYSSTAKDTARSHCSRDWNAHVRSPQDRRVTTIAWKKTDFLPPF